MAKAKNAPAAAATLDDAMDARAALADSPALDPNDPATVQAIANATITKIKTPRVKREPVTAAAIEEATAAIGALNDLAHEVTQHEQIVATAKADYSKALDGLSAARARYIDALRTASAAAKAFRAPRASTKS